MMTVSRLLLWCNGRLPLFPNQPQTYLSDSSNRSLSLSAFLKTNNCFSFAWSCYCKADLLRYDFGLGNLSMTHSVHKYNLQATAIAVRSCTDENQTV